MNPTFAEVEALLLSRWPETKLEPSLDRIQAICALMGDPQQSAPVIQLTGTNGKTSTSRMIDALIRGLGLRTGRFTSPHLQRLNERISLDGEPLTDELFVDAYADVAIYADLIDAQQAHRLSFFEMLVAMAYAAFADAPVDAAIVEVGMGGVWDATSVADASVAVLTPIAVDHAQYLGSEPELIAVEKSGIIKPGGRAVVAEQSSEVLDVVLRRAAEVGAPVVREGIDFWVDSRLPAVGGQQFTIHGIGSRYDDILLKLYGSHQARNASLALAAVEVFTGAKELDSDVVREAFGTVTSPGRLEVIRRSPTIVLDAAHNPHGIEALVETVTEEFTFSPLIGVVSVMADKDVEAILRGLEPIIAHLIVTQNSFDRAMATAELAELAIDVFGADRVSAVPRLDDAIEHAIFLADATEGFEEALGSGGVLVTGSVITVGEARTLLGGTA